MKDIKKTISNMDLMAGNFGFSQNFGLVEEAVNALQSGNTPRRVAQEALTVALQQDPNIVTQILTNQFPGKSITNYSLNPAISARGAGKSTFQISVSVAKTGTGAVGDSFPIWLFGSAAYNNTDVPYAIVRYAGQAASLRYDPGTGKNQIVLTYGGGGNTTAYTISLETVGDYPYILNSLNGDRSMLVDGFQMEISDVTLQTQLKSGLATFALDEFGKAVTNDLTTPKDLYQQQSDGVFIPHKFEASARKGLQHNILNVDGLKVTYYMFADIADMIK